jgi:hypothetical protein
MAWVAPPVYTAGSPFTAAQANGISSDLSFLANPPTLRVFNSAAINVPTGVNTFMTFNSESDKNDIGMHSTSLNTDRLVCTVAGMYLIGAQVNWPPNGAGFRQIFLSKNNALTLAGHSVPPNTGGGIGTDLPLATMARLAVGDYVIVGMFQNSGGTLAVQPGSGSLTAWMQWVAF